MFNVALGSLKATVIREGTAASVQISENSPLGKHLYRKRLELGMKQKDVAKEIGVTTETIWNWENGYSEPFTNYYPGIIRFLGYNPIPLNEETLEAKLYSARVTLGFSYRRLAKVLGTTEDTVAAWEKSINKPTAKSLKRLEKLWLLYEDSKMS